MRLGIACTSTRTLGHASVARALAQRALEEFASLEHLVIISDQRALLEELTFMPEGIELVSLGEEAVPPLDVLLIDSVPFRRPEMLQRLVPTLPQPRPTILVGHTGWVIGSAPELASRWAAELAALGAAQVILYHPEEVCRGGCHLNGIAQQLGIPVVHTGLLLPSITPGIKPRPKRFMAVAGGGSGATEAAAYAAAQVELLKLVAAALSTLPDWTCDFFAGPYAPNHEPLPRLRRVRGVTNVAERLRSYQFSFTLAGYSACCEHVSAGVPTIVLPVDHPEQRANANWVRPYLPTVTFEPNALPSIRAAASTLTPKPFSWLEIDAARSRNSARLWDSAVKRT
jgi:hypothetical protein